MSFSRGSLSSSSGRGNWRRGGRGWHPKSFPKVPSGPYGSEVDSIDIKAVLIENDSPEINYTSYVASYNWVNGIKPVVLVPGSPPAWTPPLNDTQLKQDEGDFFRDINAAHYPSFPMEPAVRSILALQPNFNLPAVDIVGCGSTLGNILRFAGSQKNPFRCDVDVIGSTIFFLRRENSPTELIADVRGYGHTFPDAYTTWDADVRSSVSHQRIISYEFGDLRMLVRTETDAYVKSAADRIIERSPTLEIDLGDIVSTISVSNSSPSEDGQVQLKLQGREVPQNQIFDIKTRAKLNILEMEEILPRLWLNQTPKFLLAYHERGIFNKPEVKDIREQIDAWQKDNSRRLGLFHAILRRIVEVAQDSETKQLEVSWDGQGSLLITEQVGSGRRALPSELREVCGDVVSA